MYVAMSAPRFLSAYAITTRLLVLLLSAAMGAGLLWLDRQIRAHVTSRAWRRAALTCNRLGIGLIAVALLSEVIGATELARFLNSALVRSVYAAVLLYGSLPILHGIIHLTLRSRRAWSTHPKHVSANLERRLSTALNWIILILFTEKVLNAFHITDGLAMAVTAVINFKIAIGAIEFTLGSVLIFAAVIVVASISSRILRYFLTSRLYSRMELTHGTGEAISKLLHYAVLAVGFFIALGAAGIEMTKFTVLAGGLSVGIGFGMQNIVNNFVSGLILLFERPLHVGDKVTVGATSGLVTDIGIRASTIRTWDGADVVIPNASLISGDFTNWNLTDERRRVEVKIGVAYGTDPARVIGILIEAAQCHPKVLRDPKPGALFTGFGQSSLDFVLRVWTLFDVHVDVSSELHMALWERLTREGIEIPFPQRDLNLRNVHPSVLESFRQPPKPEESSESAGV
jgi:small-conductance mechanosensitive channel